MDEPARQLNHSGMATQGRAGIVDTVPESSHLLHWNCIYSSIYIYVHKIVQMERKEKKEKREKKYKYCMYILPHIHLEWCTGMCQEGENVRGLIETPLFIHVYTGGCQIYSDFQKWPNVLHFLIVA